MIIIADDTFNERHKFNDISFLEEEKYQNVCSVKTTIKNSEINNILAMLTNSDLFCYHFTLQLYDVNGYALNQEKNDTLRQKFIQRIKEKQIPTVTFSGSINSDWNSKQLDKNLFYANLKSLLDYYIDNNKLETKILFYGKNYEVVERNTAIKAMFQSIRRKEQETFMKNQAIRLGLKYLYEDDEEINQTISSWTNNNLSKKEIINQVNSKISQ